MTQQENTGRNTTTGRDRLKLLFCGVAGAGIYALVTASTYNIQKAEDRKPKDPVEIRTLAEMRDESRRLLAEKEGYQNIVLEKASRTPEGMLVFTGVKDEVDTRAKLLCAVAQPCAVTEEKSYIKINPEQRTLRTLVAESEKLLEDKGYEGILFKSFNRVGGIGSMLEFDVRQAEHDGRRTVYEERNITISCDNNKPCQLPYYLRDQPAR